MLIATGPVPVERRLKTKTNGKNGARYSYQTGTHRSRPRSRPSGAHLLFSCHWRSVTNKKWRCLFSQWVTNRYGIRVTQSIRPGLRSNGLTLPACVRFAYPWFMCIPNHSAPHLAIPRGHADHALRHWIAKFCKCNTFFNDKYLPIREKYLMAFWRTEVRLFQAVRVRGRPR